MAFPKRARQASAIALAIVIAGLMLTSGHFPKTGDHYGVWSIVPPMVALLLAFTLREVIPALFLGIFLGAVISGRPNVIQDFLIPSVGSPAYGLILIVYLWALGGLIGLWTRTGGAMRFAKWAGRGIVRGPRSAKFFTWMIGIIFHQGGTISTILAGTTVRPITDRYRVSHEELSYLVDSTASPAATVIPFNVWPIYVGGLVVGSIPVLESQQAAINMFFRSVPFNFYSMFAVLFTLLFAWERLPLLPGRRMKRAIRRARTTGQLDRPEAEPLTSKELTELKVPEQYRPSLIDFFVPIGTLIGVATLPFVYTFYILGDHESAVLPIAEAFVLAVVVAMFVAIIKGLPLKEVIGGFVSGCKGVTVGAIILALAVTLKSVTDAVGTAPYIVASLGDAVNPIVLPSLLLLVTMLVAFSTGSSWGTYAVIFPVALPLAWALRPDPTFIQLCFAAVTGGSVFGDQCSPISDTTILSSLATGCDLMDHVYTQLPMALGAAGLAALLYMPLTMLLT